MNYQTHTFQNGIRLIHKPDTSPVAYCGIIVNAGTRDEDEQESGMAHFVEHMLFKGTEKRKAWHILNRLDALGGELNAYTTKEETVVNATVLSNYYEQAMELVADVIFHSTFPKNELEKEKEVVLDEIRSYQDSPSELIFDDFETLVFGGNSFGRHILGNKKYIKKFNSEKAHSFVERCYNTDEMVFFSLGNVDFKKIIRWGEKYLAKIPVSSRSFERAKPVAYNPVQKTIRKNTFQAHFMAGNRAFELGNERKAALHLFNNILGGTSMNSRLNLSLRERNGLVYSVDSVYTPYSDTGVFCIYFGCDKKNLERCIALMNKEMKTLREQKITALQLSKARKQLMGQLAVMSEHKENLALSMGKSFLHFNRFDGLDVVYQRLEEVTSEDILEIANGITAEKDLATLIYC
ncbi:MAG: insulinase family protein [Prevotellaceae bacterium]|jgi:predicted Zn-dependent peptidase|nr:insulinase family protein [Prevotellaceae bacterium]